MSGERCQRKRQKVILAQCFRGSIPTEAVCVIRWSSKSGDVLDKSCKNGSGSWRKGRILRAGQKVVGRWLMNKET